MDESEEKCGKQSKSRLNYERYRTVIQSAYLGADECACLKQIHLEEEGAVGVSTAGGDKSSKGGSLNTTSTATPKVGSSNYYSSLL